MLSGVIQRTDDLAIRVRRRLAAQRLNKPLQRIDEPRLDANPKRVVTQDDRGPDGRDEERAEMIPWHSDKWPAYKTVGFLLFTSAGLWLAVGLALRALIR